MTDQVPSSPQPSEVLAGSIERVTFHNAENGFCELRSKGPRPPCAGMPGRDLSFSS